jgi:soluble lytic murein transglycosylase-like protein
VTRSAVIASARALAGVLALSPLYADAAPRAPASAPAEAIELRVFRHTQQERFDPVILDAAIRWRHDPFLLKGLLYTESRLRHDIVNPRTGAAGIAQFTASGRHAVALLRRARGAKGPFTQANALDPVDAIDAAAEVLAYLRDQYGLDGALAAYNAGPGAGSAVLRRGYWAARDRVGGFLLVVLRHTNRLRTEAGLPPLAPPPRKPAKRPPLPTS